MKRLFEFGYTIENNEFEIAIFENVEIISFRYVVPNKIYCLMSVPTEGTSGRILSPKTGGIPKKLKFYEMNQDINENLIGKYWGTFEINGSIKYLFELNT